MKYYCSIKEKFITENDMEKHPCLAVRRGKNKGKPCRGLLRYESQKVFVEARTGNILLSDETIDKFIAKKRKGQYDVTCIKKFLKG